MSFSSLLPKPKHSKISPQTPEVSRTISTPSNNQIIPITAKSSRTIAVKYTEDGQIDYGLIAAQGHSTSRNIQSAFADTVPLNEKIDLKNSKFPKPGPEEVRECVERTRKALQKIIDSKVQASKIGPGNNNALENRNEPTYVKYTSNNIMDDGSKPRERIVKIVDIQEDPMLPPKFKLRKNRGGPPSPPPPVLRSPPREVSKQEQDQWNIPAAISNWKNPQGFTVSIEKRLASNRNIQDLEINDNFGNLSEALEVAERQAREEIKLRADMQRKFAEKEQMEKEEKLRLLAENARRERMHQDEGPSKRQRYG